MISSQPRPPNRLRAQAASNAARVGEAMTRDGIIDDMQLRSALAHLDKFGGRLGAVVVELGFVPESAVVATLCAAFNLAPADLDHAPRDPAALSKLDANFCQGRGVFPFALRDSGKTLCLAMAEPFDLDLADAVSSMTGCRVKEFAAGEGEIRKAIDRSFHRAEHSVRVNPSVPANETEMEPERNAVVGAPVAAELTAVSAAMHPSPAPKPLSAAAVSGIPAEVAVELEDLRKRVDKAMRVIRALVEVGEAKGLFTADDLRAIANRKHE